MPLAAFRHNVGIAQYIDFDCPGFSVSFIKVGYRGKVIYDTAPETALRTAKGSRMLPIIIS